MAKSAKSAKGARKGARRAGSAAAREREAETRQFPSTSPENRDRQREEGVAQAQSEKYPGSPEQQKARAKEAEAKAPRKAGAGSRAVQQEDVSPRTELSGVVASGIDHAAFNHPRSEHEHRPGEARGSVEGPAPMRLSEAADDNTILETIRKENKADALYFMRRQERESENPREWVIDSLNARLVEVQGAPILPE